MTRFCKGTIRRLWHAPHYSLFVIVSFAIGIGAASALFIMAKTVYLYPLPYEKPGELFIVRSVSDRTPMRFQLSGADFDDLSKAGSGAFSSTAIESGASIMAFSGEQRLVKTERLSSGAFAVAGANPEFGRVIAEHQSQQQEVVLSHRLWQQVFESRTSVLGQVIHLDDVPFSVVGVMPDGFAFPEGSADLWLSLDLQKSITESRNARAYTVLGRKESDLSWDAIRSRIAGLSASLGSQYSEDRGWSLSIDPLVSTLRAPQARIVQLIALAAMSIFLACCANASSLVLAHGLDRSSELAVKQMLGARRSDVVGEMLLESGVLSVSGAALGLGLAELAIRLARSYGTDVVPRLGSATMDWWAVSFAGVLSVVAGTLSGSLPAALLDRKRLASVAKEAWLTGRASTGGRASSSWGKAIVVAEVAVAVVLCSFGLLLAEALMTISKTDTGITERPVISADVPIPRSRLSSTVVANNILQPFRKSIADDASVRAVALASSTPLVGGGLSRTVVVGNDHLQVMTPLVSEGYFDVLQIPILFGRDFATSDNVASAPVAIVNRRLSDQLAQGRSAVGLLVPSTSRTIVGVVENSRDSDLTHPAGLEMYVPVSQADSPMLLRKLAVLVRSDEEPQKVAALMRRVASQTIGERQPIVSVRTLESIKSGKELEPRFKAVMFALVSLIGVAIALTGTYGLVSQSTRRRRRDMAVRLALGAPPLGLVRCEVLRALSLVSVGIVVGWIATTLLVRLLGSVVVGVGGLEPTSAVAIALLVLAGGAVASYVPARNAARINILPLVGSE